jgi:hypothetical protein
VYVIALLLKPDITATHERQPRVYSYVRGAKCPNEGDEALKLGAVK